MTAVAPASVVFVFGSNLAGRHGKGAALYARQHFGAKAGVGEGLTGSAYAIPTKDAQLRVRCITDIRSAVVRFIAFAKHHPEMCFQVTRVGCGLAGYRDADIAPMFAGAPSNCDFDDAWRPFVDGAITRAPPRSRISLAV